jgi:hypothetical protein
MKAATTIVTILFFITILFVMTGCKKSADTRLSQMETIVTKWENRIGDRSVEFDDLVMIQEELTVYDVDQKNFEHNYGSLNSAGQTRLTTIRNRLKALMRKRN